MLLTVLVIEPKPGAPTARVKVVEVLGAKVNAGQVTAPLLDVPPLEALRKVLPEGNVSVTVTQTLVEEPLLVTVMV